MKTTLHFLIVFQVFKKFCQVQPMDLLIVVILLGFTSADLYLIFYKFPERHSTFSKKKNYFKIFSF